ncbi:MAG: hypothetical protein ACLPYS_06900 [Vulcanimicrobiaceae bacterium]
MRTTHRAQVNGRLRDELSRAHGPEQLRALGAHLSALGAQVTQAANTYEDLTEGLNAAQSRLGGDPPVHR